MTDENLTPSQMKGTKWCITYWLTEGRTLDTLNQLVASMPSNWHLEGQIEQGLCKQNKLHAQLYLKTEHTRGTKIAKFFPNAYLSPAKNPFALEEYVHKVESRVGEFKTVENRSPQWKVVRQMFFKWYASTFAEQTVFKVTDDEKMVYWDRFIGISLEEGMEIDLIGVNPQYRSCIMRYWENCLRIAISVDRQTDRQEDPPKVVAPPPPPPPPPAQEVCPDPLRHKSGVPCRGTEYCRVKF